MTGEKTRLYLITPPKFRLEEFFTAFGQACEGGDIACLQLRLKEVGDEEILKAAEVLIPLCHARDIAFILNDRPDLAKQCGADGIHLGQEDLENISIEEARAIVGEDAVIGVSCHASKDLGLQAGEQGADYVTFGAFYPTLSKPVEKQEKWGTPGLDILNWWQEMVQVPCVAIGGITPQNAAPLVAAGADFIAAITSVWEYPEGPKEAVRAFNACIRDAKGPAGKQ